MFAARTALTTREVYFTLSEKLRELFQSEEGCVITLVMGVDPADDRCLKLLARVRTFGGKGGGKWQECMMMSFPAIKNDVIMRSWKWEWRPEKVRAREVGGKRERSVLGVNLVLYHVFC